MLLPIKDVMPARKSISRTQDGCADNALMNRRITVAAILLALTGSLVVTAPSVRAASPIVGIGTVYAGMYSSQWEATADLEAMAAWAGKKATFAGTFHDVFESAGSNWAGNTAWLLEQAWQAEATPVANLGINASAAAIAGGSYDNAIIAWANRVKAWTETPGGPQRTLFIAPLQEHNGDWTSYGCDPTNFRLAYARIRSLVQGVGLDETRVRWVWAPNGWTSDVGACKGKTLSDYYPGSEIVDVIGYSAYRWGEENVYTAVAGVADALRAIDSTKPYLVLQTAAWNTGSGSKEQWIRDLFSWATDDQNVVGIVWFNLAKETDWRVWNSTTQAGLSTGWRDALSSSSTIHTWPLTDWFQPGRLVIDALPGPCPDGSVCDTVAFVNSAGRWYRHDGLGSGDPVTAFYFGNPGDVPFMGDWDCDGVRTPGLYRQSDGFVYLRNTNTQGVADITFFFGNPGDVPVAGDFDGDDCDTLSIYRPADGRFFVVNELGRNGGGLGAADYAFWFGNPGDNPFVGDFDGDGIDTIGLYRTSTGFAYFRNSLATGIADLSFFYGDPGDKIVAGDWDGDGDDTVAVYRPSTGWFYVNFDNAQGNADYALYVGSYVAAARG